jgi:hypothetical protein
MLGVTTTISNKNRISKWCKLTLNMFHNKWINSNFPQGIKKFRAQSAWAIVFTASTTVNKKGNKCKIRGSSMSRTSKKRKIDTTQPREQRTAWAGSSWRSRLKYWVRSSIPITTYKEKVYLTAKEAREITMSSTSSRQKRMAPFSNRNFWSHPTQSSSSSPVWTSPFRTVTQ